MELTPTLPVFLLLYLAYQRTWVTRERLATLFWPECPDDTARHNLRVTLSRARKFPWAEPLEVETHRLRFDVPSDASAFREAIGRGDWLQATRVYERPFLDDVPMSSTPSFEAWAQHERDTLAHAWRNATVQLSADLEREGEYAAAAARLERLLTPDDVSEEVMQAYLRCAYLAGHRQRALRHFEWYAAYLRAELGVAPLAATLDLAETVRQSGTIDRRAPSPPERAVPLTVRRPAVLVGRGDAWQRVASADTPVVLVSGEPGVGKTRLLNDAFPDARLVRCREGLRQLAYAPLMDALRRHETARHGHPAYHAELARLLPELTPHPPVVPDDPELARARLVEAIAWTVEQESTPLIVDDLQWADPATLEVLTLVAARGHCRIYGTYRAQEISDALHATLQGWRAGRLLTDIPLFPLREAEMIELLEHLTKRSPGPVRFGRWLRRVSGGNPFFALETLRSLFESGRLWADANGWHTNLDELTLDYSELEVPGAVSDLITRRISGLTSNAQLALQAASVIGEGFGVHLIARVTGLSEWNAVEALDEAEAAGIIRGDRFGHDLSRQSLYAALTDARRQHLHASVASALEDAAGNTADPLAEPLVIAEHWLAGGNASRAWPLLYQAALRDLERAEFSRAVAQLERVIHGTLPGDTLHLEAQLTLGAQLLFSDLTDGRQRLEAVVQALRTADLPERPRLLASAYTALADNAVYAGDQHLAGVWLGQIRPLLPDLPLPERLGALATTIEVAMRDSDLPRFTAALNEARHLAPHSVPFQAYGALLHWFTGEFELACDAFEQILTEHPDAARSLTLENDLGMTYWAMGRPGDAVLWLQRSLSTWRGVHHTEGLSHSNLGLVRISQGRYADALTELNVAETLTRRVGSNTFLADVLYRRALTHARCGQLADAVDLYTEALKLMVRVGDPFRTSYIHASLSSAILHLSGPEAADAHLTAAHALATSVGHPIIVSLTQRAQVERAFITGDTAAAGRAAGSLVAYLRRYTMNEHLAYALLLHADALQDEPAAAARTEALSLGRARGLPDVVWRAASALHRTEPSDELHREATSALNALLTQSPPGRFRIDVARRTRPLP